MTLLEILLQIHKEIGSHTAMGLSCIPPVFISVGDERQQSAMLDVLDRKAWTEDACIIVDAQADGGPTSGLLAAHSIDLNAHFVVTGCDYPMLATGALIQLMEAHVAAKPAVTCFVNDDGWTEPLLAIWSPSALSSLQQLASSTEASVGPNRAIRLLERVPASENREPHKAGILKIRSRDSSWIINVNTPEEYENVRKVKDTGSRP